MLKRECHCNERYFCFTTATTCQNCGCCSATVSHLGEGQAVLVCLLVFELKVIESFALRWWLRQRFDDLDKVGGEEAVDSTHLPVVPVLIHLPAQDDNVTLAKLEVSWFLAIIVVERLGTRELGYTLQTEIESKMRRGLRNRDDTNKGYELHCIPIRHYILILTGNQLVGDSH